MPTFFPGQKVVCVDDITNDKDAKPEPIRNRRIYTVRWCGIYDSVECVRLMDVRRDIHPQLGVEYAYSVRRFKPKAYEPLHVILMHPIDQPEQGEVFSHAETIEAGTDIVGYLNRTSTTHRYRLMAVPPIPDGVRRAWGEIAFAGDGL